MYSPDKQGDYTPKSGVQNFLVQWLTDALATPNSEVTKVSQPAEEYVLLLEVMMADRPGCPRPPTFSWNSSIILHILKRDPALRDLEHVQVDGPGTVYLFFYDKQGHKGLKKEATENIQPHITEAFSEWISHSAHFVATPLPLAEGWHRATTALGRHHPKSRTDQLDHPASHGLLRESDSTPQLVGGAPPDTMWAGQMDDGISPSLRVPGSPPQGRPQNSAPPEMAGETHRHPHQGGMAQTQMDTPLSIRCQGPIVITGGGITRNVWHWHVWTCQYLN